MPKIIIEISGGVAEISVSDRWIECEIIDWDNINSGSPWSLESIQKFVDWSRDLRTDSVDAAKINQIVDSLLNAHSQTANVAVSMLVAALKRIEDEFASTPNNIQSFADKNALRICRETLDKVRDLQLNAKSESESEDI